MDWLRDHRLLVQKQLEQHGALLFRGFAGLDTPQSFAAVVGAITPTPRDYIEGQSPRTRLAAHVYNATDYPADQKIALHNELSYTPDAPKWLIFGCQYPADIGGETPLLDGRTFVDAIPDDIATAFENKRVRYIKNMHNGRGFGKSWQAHYETDERAVVERFLRAADTQFTWTQTGGLRIVRDRPWTARHPATGARVWFNQAHLWHVSHLGEVGAQLCAIVDEHALPTHATFADGTSIADDVMNVIRSLCWQQSVMLSWRQGDILLVDNYAVAHGRNAYTGNRSLYVTMV